MGHKEKSFTFVERDANIDEISKGEDRFVDLLIYELQEMRRNRKYVCINYGDKLTIGMCLIDDTNAINLLILQ